MIDTERFLETPAPFYDGVATILPAIDDTLIFFSISLRLANNSFGHKGRMSRMRTFFTGHGLRSLSKTLLQSGQSYYACVISSARFDADSDTCVMQGDYTTEPDIHRTPVLQ